MNSERQAKLDANPYRQPASTTAGAVRTGLYLHINGRRLNIGTKSTFLEDGDVVVRLGLVTPPDTESKKAGGGYYMAYHRFAPEDQLIVSRMP